jgi:4-amino-4-deoxy-L-arabinose transferase-like glycosyltransferase
MIVFGLAPFVALLLIILLYTKKRCNWPESILLGSIAWLFGISLLTQATSLANAIDLANFAWIWTVSIAILIILYASYPVSVKWGGVTIADYSTTERISLVLIGIIFAATLLVALSAPPNNWDSQVYHLARIEHWIQNRSLTPYPTAIARQIAYPELAETVMLQPRVLSGSDRLDQLVQWFAALGSVVAVGKIASRLGAGRQGSILASLFVASLPIMILESTNTKNNVLLSYLLLCTAERLLAWNETRSLRDAAYMSIAAGLALATKSTAYFIAAPFGLFFLVTLARQPKKAIGHGIVCLSLLLLPNWGHYARNLAFYGASFGLSVGKDTLAADFGLGPLVLNAIRNITVNLASFDVSLNQRITLGTIHLIQTLGLDPNDPAMTYLGRKFGLVPWQNDEEFAGNPLHLIVAVIALAATIRPTSPPARLWYGLSVLAAGVLFTIVLRWQPWITRLQMPLFALTAPMVGCVSVLQKRERFAIALLAALALSSVPALMASKTRSLVALPNLGVQSLFSQAPVQLRFARRRDLLFSYEAAVRYVLANDHHDIALLMDTFYGDDWEYPFWQLLQQAQVEPLRIEHVFVSSSSGDPNYPLGPFRPTLIIATIADRPSEMVINGVIWNRRVELPELSLYTPAR